jgi:hypothetical protein
MKVAIMQPYFLPYLGYFQLIKAVDTFVFYDDVTFIKQGWINRNRILLNNKDFLFNLEMKGASSFKNINTIEIGNNRNKLLKTFIQAYKKAPYFKDIESILVSIFETTQSNLSLYVINTIQLIANYFGLNTEFLISSEIEKNNGLKGQDKVIEICRILDANIYINSIGGRELYSKDDFTRNGIELSFIQTKRIEYKQYSIEFIPWLSIIDIMMFNSLEEINMMLDEYELI